VCWYELLDVWLCVCVRGVLHMEMLQVRGRLWRQPAAAGAVRLWLWRLAGQRAHVWGCAAEMLPLTFGRSLDGLAVAAAACICLQAAQHHQTSAFDRSAVEKTAAVCCTVAGAP
jgi:hypothetical protein